MGDDPTRDPWASSPVAPNRMPSSAAAHTIPTSAISETYTAHINGLDNTSSTFTKRADEPSATGDPPKQSSSAAGDGNAWTSYNGSGGGGFQDQSTTGGGFGGGDDQSNRPGQNSQPSMTSSVVIPPGTGEVVTVTMLPEKEGMFLFQHHNYEVKTVRRGSSVVRRYSDFVWLLDCLQKKYPFRRLPLLPPKRVQGW